MAGGKETPRQKMIGMMYLVLMAMLALNVSKSIIDAFVAIEENIQIASQNEHARGLEKRVELEEKMKTGDTPEVKAKAKKLMDFVDQIDKITAEQIQYLDALKLEILNEIKEEPAKLKAGPESIIMVDFDNKFPLRPIRMNLAHVTNKDKYDESMRIFGIDKNLKTPTEYACKHKPGLKGGIELWNQMNSYRGKLCEILVASSSDSVKYSFVDPKIVEYKDLADLQKKVNEAMKKSKIKSDDLQEVTKIYTALTKNESWVDEHEPGGVHWLAKTFNHAPSVAAIASLSGLQKEILTARADAVSLIRSRLGGGDYSFNSIQGLAFPESSVLNPGDQFEMTVMMAAYDSDKQPVVKPSQGTVTSVANGRAIVKLTAPSTGEMKITGTVGVANKRGEIKEMPYETKIQVATKAGSISLPELAVLYTSWDNKVVPVTSGTVSSDITVQGGTKTKKSWTADGQKFDGYYVNVAPGTRQVVIALNGKDRTGKSINFGSFKYKVKPFPAPLVQGGTISKASGTKVIVGLGADSPFTGVTFNVTGGEITVGDVVTSFTGDRVPAAAIAKAKIGKKVSIDVFYTRNGMKGVPISSSLKVVP
ncbi:MAG: hypothetical protein FGM14_06695 [Flavobacteriales bacterium]|nr:hypothetical protein [Flavobacteriales bacterium]